eukprot:RCo019783
MSRGASHRPNTEAPAREPRKLRIRFRPAAEPSPCTLWLWLEPTLRLSSPFKAEVPADAPGSSPLETMDTESFLRIRIRRGLPLRIVTLTPPGSPEDRGVEPLRLHGIPLP